MIKRNQYIGIGLYAFLYAIIATLVTLTIERLPVFLLIENAVYDNFQKWLTLDSREDQLYSRYQKELASIALINLCLLYTSPSPRDRTRSRMPSSA